jgi:hypothetical protein
MKSDHLIELAIIHVIVSVNKLFKLFYTIHYDILCGVSMKKYNIAHECGVATIWYFE